MANNNGVKRYKGAVEYIMPKQFADSLVKEEKMKGNKVSDVPNFLLKVVNEQFGLKTPCVRVIVE